MKKISSLLIALSLLLATTSCSKKDDSQPAAPTAPTGGTGGTGGTTTTKTLKFYQSTVPYSTSKISVLDNSNNVLASTSLANAGYTRTNGTASACGESASGYIVSIHSSGTYNYKVEQINGNNAPTLLASGSFVILSDGSISNFTQTTKPATGPGMVNDNCGSMSNFTINYK